MSGHSLSSRVAATVGEQRRVRRRGEPASPTRPRPEVELLLCCARTRLDAGQSGRIRGLLSSGIDWGSLLRLARQHGLEPLLYRSLTGAVPDHVPPEVVEVLRTEYHANAAHSLLLFTETARLLGALRAAGIEAVPLKGPTTALTAYGDITLRDSVDIDLLVPPEQAAQAGEVFRSEGYRPEHDVTLTEAQHRAFIRLCQHERFIRCDRGVEVELHWRPAPLAYAPDPAAWQPWRRCRLVSWGGRDIALPAPEDQLLLLSLHGYSHLFSCLKWVADIAEVVRSEPDLDHDAARREATRLRCLRAVLLGYLLAGELLGAPVPPSVLEQARADRAVARIAAEVQRRYCQAAEIRLSPVERARSLLLRLRAIDRPAERVRFCFRRLVPYAKPDVAWLSVPSCLQPLYWLTGPVRILRQVIASIARG